MASESTVNFAVSAERSHHPVPRRSRRQDGLRIVMFDFVSRTIGDIWSEMTKQKRFEARTRKGKDTSDQQYGIKISTSSQILLQYEEGIIKKCA